PTLEEFLSLLPDDMLINAEIKALPSDNRNIEDRMIEIFKKFPKKNNILISSFNHQLLHRLHFKYPQYKIGILTDTDIKNMGEHFRNFPLEITSINISLELAQEPLIKELKDSGFKVFVYTVNDKDIALSLKGIGVDGIFSDYPDILSEFFHAEEKL
ncbi:MAG: glycerophosphodiester phosphodiesterase, partial [Fusobacteriaceae bacterium]